MGLIQCDLAGGMGRGESCSSTEQANGTSVSAPLFTYSGHLGSTVNKLF